MRKAQLPIKVIRKDDGKTIYKGYIRILGHTYEGAPLLDPLEITRLRERFFDDDVLYWFDSEYLARYMREPLYV